ncbi:MAG: hypothetical protein OXI26_09555 [bacterium]|nr:hypothetical protein [bacterium]
MSPTVDEPSAQLEAVRSPRVDTAALQRRTGIVCVIGACLFVFWQMRPDLLFSATTPAGGDMAAHVWGPAYLRDHLLPLGRLSGWSPDWYAGFPAFHFYMVLPSLAIALASFVIPYGVAFKLVAIAGLVSLPLAAATFVRLAGLRFPAPTIAALFTLPFLFDTTFSIYGGNAASTLAGEFAYSISLSLMLVYLGVLLRGLRTGRHRVLAGALLALVGLTHLIPAIFAVAATGVALMMQPGRRRVRWVTVTGALAAALAAFWLLPFWWRRDFYHNIDWVNLTEYWPNLVRDDWNWVLVGAWAALLVGILRRRRLVLYLAALAALAAAGYRWLPQGVLWNARLLPFYYLTMLLLVGVGIAALLATLVAGGPLRETPAGTGAESPRIGEERKRRRWLPEDSPRLRIVLAAVLPAGAVAVAIDDLVADSATLRALLEVFPGIEVATAPDRAADVAHLALLILTGAAVVVVVEILRALRAQGFRSRASGLVVLGRPEAATAAAGALRPAEGTPTSAGGMIRPLGATRGTSSRAGVVLVLGTVALVLVIVAIVAYPLRALGPAGGEVPDGRYGLKVAPNVVLAGTTQKSFLPFWVYWNFSGYEAKEPREGIGGYHEYYRVVTTMAAVAGERGCGRVMWEYGLKRLDSYGSPMSLMLLPHWTDGCLASMEGLFFESTQTVPFHFINQDELSLEPSRPVRAVSYGGPNLAAGVAHMQLFGVRYYMAFSDSLIAEARAHEDLTEVAAEPPWVMFELADAPLVSPLAAEPVIVSGAGDDPEAWLEVAEEFYATYPGSRATDPDAGFLSSAAVFPAASGPESWAEVSTGSQRPVRSLEEIQVHAVSATPNSINFRVDRSGVPVLVKASYFPNWQVDGGAGPYRVAPNFMVVVPTETEVTLTYGWTPVDVLAWVITAAGVIVALVLWRNPHIWTAEADRRAPWE